MRDGYDSPLGGILSVFLLKPFSTVRSVMGNGVPSTVLFSTFFLKFFEVEFFCYVTVVHIADNYPL